MHPHLLRLALRPPFSPAVLEVADEFLLLGVHRDDRIARPQIRLGRGSDVGELGIAIRVVRSFARLAVGLQAIAQRLQQLGHFLMAHAMALRVEFAGQAPHALAGPAQRRLGVPARDRLDQPLQVGAQRRILGFQRLAPTAGPTDPAWLGPGDLPPQLADSQRDRFARQARGARHRRDAAPAQGERFGGCHHPSCPFIEHPSYALIALLDQLVRFHSAQSTPCSFPSATFVD